MTFLRENDGVDENGEPRQVKIYPPINSLDDKAFLRQLADAG